MEVTYKSTRLEKLCTNAYAAEKKYGIQMAEKLKLRIDQISAAISVEMMLQFKVGRCHQLKGDRKNQFAVDLVHPYRLIFEKQGDEIQIANIMEIVDYH